MARPNLNDPLPSLNKRVLLVFFTLFLGAQLFEILTQREDYPLTRWGMYRRHPDFKNFINLVVKIDNVRPAHGLFKNPWKFRRELWDIVCLGNTRKDRPDKLDLYLKIAEECAASRRSEIEILLKRSLKDPQIPQKFSIYFLAWETLSKTNINQPEILATLYEKDF